MTGHRKTPCKAANQERVERRRSFMVAAVLALPALAGCNNEKLVRWEEQVTLSSGETLLLERATRYRRGGEPYNPLQVTWGREDSSLRVREGPSDLVGARYTLKDWFDPLVLDRDANTRQLILIGTAWSCDWVKPYAGKNRSIYVAFELRAEQEAAAVDFPPWAWDRERNLYKPYVHIDPPRLVTPEHASEHNSTKAQGDKRFFVVDPTVRAPSCPGEGT